MKKVLTLFALVFGLISTIVYAEKFDLGYVDLNFCNTQDQFHIQTVAGSQTGFCFILKNHSNTTGTIKLSLVDGKMGLRGSGVTSCKTTSSGFFSMFVTLSGAATGGMIELPPNTGVVQRANINIPNEFIGMLNGCVVFSSDTNQPSGLGMLQVSNRKENGMDISVSGAYVNMFGFMNMKSYSGDKWQRNLQEKIISSEASIIVTQLQEKNKLIIGLKNTGFIDENYTITGVVSNNYFGQTVYSKSFVIGSGILYGQDKMVVEYPIDDLPFYKGKYNIDVTVTHVPIAISGFSLGETPGNISNHQFTSFVIYPGLLVIGIAILPIVLVCVIVVVVLVLTRNTKYNVSKKKMVF